jgi:cobalt-zinc-cadmium efflux system outer membrane protein
VRRLPLHALALALTLALGGCATLAPDPDPIALDRLLQERGAPTVAWTGPAATADALPPIDTHLAEPLDRARAVAIAMLRSPRMRQEYARLGLERADVIEAVEIANPGLSLARPNLSPAPGHHRIISLSLPFVDVLMAPQRIRWAQQQHERHALEVAQAVIGLTADVEAAWYRAVAAEQIAALREAVAEGTAATAELAQRFHDAGNLSDLELAREQAAATQARIDAARARIDAGAERLVLATLLGLGPADGDWTLADRLPLPVATEDEPAMLVERARSSNLELLAARLDAAQRRSALAATRATRWLGGVTAGVEREAEADDVRLTGPTLSLELPLFHQGQGRLARAEALHAGAAARLQQAESAVEQTVRAAAADLARHREIALLHRDALIPQHQRIVERSQQEQNFMLIGVFELARTRLEELAAWQGYLEALRDYGLARLELSRAVGQRLPSEAGATEPGPAVEEILGPARPPESGHNHHHHSHGAHGGTP